jgi:hypothetical protein
MDRRHDAVRLGRQESEEQVIADIRLRLGPAIARPGSPNTGEGEWSAVDAPFELARET